MRRASGMLVAMLVLVPLAGLAQAPVVLNSKTHPPPPPELATPPSQETAARLVVLPQLNPLLPPAPEKVYVPGGTSFAVVLETPLSTRMTKKGEPVTFLLTEAVEVDGGLEIPPDTRFTGTVTEVKRPGMFGKPGVMKVKVERIELPTGGDAPVTARLQSGDPSAVRLKADSNRAADLYNLASWTLQGTLVGASIKGGKGAAVGAGAGAAAALIILMSRRGPDLYLEPGMPFEVILDEPLELAGADVQAAHVQYRRSREMYADESGEIYDESEEAARGEDPELSAERPQLKRRPKKNTP